MYTLLDAGQFAYITFPVTCIFLSSENRSQMSVQTSFPLVTLFLLHQLQRKCRRLWRHHARVTDNHKFFFFYRLIAIRIVLWRRLKTCLPFRDVTVIVIFTTTYGRVLYNQLITVFLKACLFEIQKRTSLSHNNLYFLANVYNTW